MRLRAAVDCSADCRSVDMASFCAGRARRDGAGPFQNEPAGGYPTGDFGFGAGMSSTKLLLEMLNSG